MTPEDVFIMWCGFSFSKRPDFRDRFSNTAGRMEFLSQPEVAELARLPEHCVTAALREHINLQKAVIQATALASEAARRAATQPNTGVTKRATPSPAPTNGANRLPARRARSAKGKQAPVPWNTVDHLSASQGHRPRARPTPTVGEIRFCPACGGIEDSYRCSR